MQVSGPEHGVAGTRRHDNPAIKGVDRTHEQTLPLDANRIIVRRAGYTILKRDALADLRARLERAESERRHLAKRVKRERDRHRPRTDRRNSCCIQCGLVWPCPTSLTLDGAETDRG